jgi:hypothetical protein
VVHEWVTGIELLEQQVEQLPASQTDRFREGFVEAASGQEVRNALGAAGFDDATSSQDLLAKAFAITPDTDVFVDGAGLSYFRVPRIIEQSKLVRDLCSAATTALRLQLTGHPTVLRSRHEVTFTAAHAIKAKVGPSFVLARIEGAAEIAFPFQRLGTRLALNIAIEFNFISNTVCRGLFTRWKERRIWPDQARCGQGNVRNLARALWASAAHDPSNSGRDRSLCEIE